MPGKSQAGKKLPKRTGKRAAKHAAAYARGQAKRTANRREQHARQERNTVLRSQGDLTLWEIARAIRYLHRHPGK